VLPVLTTALQRGVAKSIDLLHSRLRASLLGNPRKELFHE